MTGIVTQAGGEGTRTGRTIRTVNHFHMQYSRSYQILVGSLPLVMQTLFVQESWIILCHEKNEFFGLGNI